MLRYISLFAFYLMLPFQALCQKTDTIITYFKNAPNGYFKVAKGDNPDVIQIIVPSVSGDKLASLTEYYKSGTIGVLGKIYWNGRKTDEFIKMGLFLRFYPDGKRESVIHYDNNQKDGDEYLYYPNGNLYCYKKNTLTAGALVKTLYWDCYDIKGNQICESGNGQWILYDNKLNPYSQGMVKKGLFDGDWTGVTANKDSIKYVYKYSRGVSITNFGYDKNGKAYPFKNNAEPPVYKTDFVTFLNDLRSKLTREINIKGIKLSKALDTAHVSFIIEKDGSLTNIKITGTPDVILASALIGCIKKLDKWTPRKYYGMPMRTQLTFPYRELSEDAEDYPAKRRIDVKEITLGF